MKFYIFKNKEKQAHNLGISHINTLQLWFQKVVVRHWIKAAAWAQAYEGAPHILLDYAMLLLEIAGKDLTTRG